MPEEKKEWVVIQFPQGPFNGTINVAIKGEWVVSAQKAQEIMSATHAATDDELTTQP